MTETVLAELAANTPSDQPFPSPVARERERALTRASGRAVQPVAVEAEGMAESESGARVVVVRGCLRRSNSEPTLGETA